MSAVTSILPLLEKAAEAKTHVQHIVYDSEYEKEIAEKWEPQDIPYSLGVTLEELPIEELGIKRCRSFRADMLHKLKVLVRAYGTSQQAAYVLRTHRKTFESWMSLRSVPGERVVFDRIDSCYETAVEKLKLQAAKKQKKLKK